MQITIAQAEIELAITDFITSQINIREGMRIDVDISATRGVNGFTAIIDIVSNKTPRKQKDGTVVVPQQDAVTSEPVNTGSIPEKGDPKPALIDRPAPVSIAVEPAKEEPVKAPELTATPAVTVAPAQSSRSLFAGLQKPTNAAS